MRRDSINWMRCIETNPATMESLRTHRWARKPGRINEKVVGVLKSLMFGSLKGFKDDDTPKK